MLLPEPSCSLDLTHEAASVTTPQEARSVKVQLLDISVTGISFIAPEKLEVSMSDQLSMRFTLPGKPRLHFAMVSLLPSVTNHAASFRYDARFIRSDPLTVEHIVQCIGAARQTSVGDTKVLHLS